METLESTTAMYSALLASRQERLKRLRGQVLDMRPSGGGSEPTSGPANATQALSTWGSLEDLPDQIEVLQSSYVTKMAMLMLMWIWGLIDTPYVRILCCIVCVSMQEHTFGAYCYVCLLMSQLFPSTCLERQALGVPARGCGSFCHS